MTITRDVGSASVIILVPRHELVDGAGCAEQYDELIERAIDHADLFEFGGSEAEIDSAAASAQAAQHALRFAMELAGHADLEIWEPDVIGKMILTCEAYLSMKHECLQN